MLGKSKDCTDDVHFILWDISLGFQCSLIYFVQDSFMGNKKKYANNQDKYKIICMSDNAAIYGITKSNLYNKS